MDIRNFTQFVSLLASKQVIHTNPAFDRVATCMIGYNSICACGGDSTETKRNKHSECNRIYREALGSIDQVKANLFQGTDDNSINFYIDESHLIRTLNR